MRTIILTAALLCSTAAFAQTTDATATTTSASGTEIGATTKVLAKGEHYTVHRVLADGTVMVKTLTGDDAEMAMAGKQPAALAAFMSAQPLTAGAGTTTPQ
jgi:Flp pilus assembly protein TadD